MIAATMIKPLINPKIRFIIFLIKYTFKALSRSPQRPQEPSPADELANLHPGAAE